MTATDETADDAPHLHAGCVPKEQVDSLSVDWQRMLLSLTERAKEAEAKLRETERERDLAIAHDRQPYPTPDAYEAVCVALDRHREALRTVLRVYADETFHGAAASFREAIELTFPKAAPTTADGSDGG